MAPRSIVLLALGALAVQADMLLPRAGNDVGLDDAIWSVCSRDVASKTKLYEGCYSSAFMSMANCKGSPEACGCTMASALIKYVFPPRRYHSCLCVRCKLTHKPQDMPPHRVPHGLGVVPPLGGLRGPDRQGHGDGDGRRRRQVDVGSGQNGCHRQRLGFGPGQDGLRRLRLLDGFTYGLRRYHGRLIGLGLWRQQRRQQR